MYYIRECWQHTGKHTKTLIIYIAVKPVYLIKLYCEQEGPIIKNVGCAKCNMCVQASVHKYEKWGQHTEFKLQSKTFSFDAEM